MSRPVLTCLAAWALIGLSAALEPARPEARGGDKVITNSIGMKLTLIPAGKFLMGSPPAEKERDAGERQHEVTITRPFYLGVYEVTQGEYAQLMGKPNQGGKHNPWNWGAHFGGANGGGPDHPMENLKW